MPVYSNLLLIQYKLYDQSRLLLTLLSIFLSLFPITLILTLSLPTSLSIFFLISFHSLPLSLSPSLLFLLQNIALINGDGSAPPTSRTPSSINPEASVFLAKTLGGESSEHTDGESDTSVLKSRQFVYKELLATEKVYIDDLKVVLNVSSSSLLRN